jgi:hypothetical protein
MNDKTIKRPSAIGRLRDLFSQPQHHYKPSTQIFLDLNVDRLAAEMDLASRGAERGAENRPDSSAETLDDIEYQIVERSESHKQDAHAVYLEHLHIYDARLASLNFEERFAIIQQSAPEAVGEFAAEASLGRDELFALRRGLNESEAEREEFRKRRRISRPARLSNTGKTLLKIGLLAVLFVIEVVVNGGFLSKANQGGYLGGIVVALVFAAFNILVSFMLGLAPIRLMFQRNFFLKILGLLSLLAYLALAVVLNLALAHVREIPPDALVDVDRIALQRLLASPFGLTEMQSWLLFGIGFVFSIIAMVDGLLFFDPVIGYAGVERRWLAVSRKFTDTKDDLIERLREIRDEASEAMNAAARDLTVRRSEYEAMMQSRGRLTQRFVEHQAHIERACNSLLQVYRQANRTARSEPAPAGFDRAYVVERIPLDVSGPDAAERERLRQSIVEIQDLLKGQIDAIHGAFDQAVKSYREIDQFFPEADRA